MPEPGLLSMATSVDGLIVAQMSRSAHCQEEQGTACTILESICSCTGNESVKREGEVIRTDEGDLILTVSVHSDPMPYAENEKLSQAICNNKGSLVLQGNSNACVALVEVKEARSTKHKPPLASTALGIDMHRDLLSSDSKDEAPCSALSSVDSIVGC